VNPSEAFPVVLLADGRVPVFEAFLSAIAKHLRAPAEEVDIEVVTYACVADLEVRHDAMDHLVPDPTARVVCVAGVA
jgi:hypothetical protein